MDTILTGDRGIRVMNTRRRVAHPPNRGATYQDVLDAPSDKAAEVIDGTLHMQPRPTTPHA